LVGYAALSADVPGVHAMPLFGPPTQVRLEQSGHGWIPGIVLLGSVAVSPAAVPLGAPPTAFRTHTLVGVLPGFGTARGPPKRQPAVVHVRLLPVWADVVPPRVAVCPVREEMVVIDFARSGTAYGRGPGLPPPPVE